MVKRKFRFRAFTALMMLWSFILETISGVILYIVPPGRIANWTNWKLWGLTKHGWGAVHTIFGYVFLIFAVIHVYYNWKPIKTYILKKVRAGLSSRAELATSLVLSVVMTVATILSVPPFGTVMDIGENFRNSWEESRNEPFVAHAELLSFAEFIQQIQLSPAQAEASLQAAGITVEDDSALIKDIAEADGISPSELYAILSPPGGPTSGSLSGRGGAPRGGGFGWKTIEDLNKDLDMPTERILEILKEEGITAKPGDVIRDVAEKHGHKAYDLVTRLQERR